MSVAAALVLLHTALLVTANPAVPALHLRLERVSETEYRLDLDVKNRSQQFRLVSRQEKEVVTLLAGEADGLVEARDEKPAFLLYEDSTAGASVTITPDETGAVGVAGLLGPDWVLRPVRGRPALASPACPACPRLLLHTIAPAGQLGPASSDYGPVEKGPDYSLGRSGRGLATPAKIQPELLVVVDHKLFKTFKFDVAETRKYIVSYFNAVNMRFKSFTSPRIELSIAGIVLGKSQSSLPFISGQVVAGSAGVLDAPAALHAMGKYYYTQRPDLPVFDMIVTLTGLDMARLKAGKMSRANSGYAYVGGACVRNVYLKKISSVALVEDSGGYSGVVVTAHELGHLLGAVHDGDAAPAYLRGPGAASCPWSRGFIMSDLRRTARGQAWSDCSVKQIKHFLRTSTARCLTGPPHKRRSELALPGTAALPGQNMSVDEQCRADRGTRACYHDHRVCAQLFCYNPDYKGCYAYRPAVEGSKCGAGRHCISGKCVSKVAPTDNKEQKKKFSKELKKRKPKIFKNTNRKSINDKSSKSEKKHADGSWNNKKNKESNKVSQQKSKAHEDSILNGKCVDSFALQGSLNCKQLFRRYSFHYCKGNKSIKKKCCQSYRRFCGKS